jgi:alginate O-acetyltransferase complex protein AlgI
VLAGPRFDSCAGTIPGRRARQGCAVLFNSVLFLFFFLPATYVVFWLLRTTRQRQTWLALSGYIFYGFWDWRFCLLMAAATVVSYLAGLSLLQDRTPAQRKLALWIPVGINLGLLGLFAYADFGIRTVEQLAAMGGAELGLSTLNLVLPVGISFYTFQTTGYVVDCYRRAIQPTRSLFEFAAFVSMFAQLVAGPILRFRQLATDLETLGSADRRRWFRRGVTFFTIGLVQKVLVADSLATFVDPALQDYASLSTWGAWAVMIAYALQLYYDFCGYSDMAVGLGFLFGLRIPQNFNSPYQATDPADFWRRWHITMSTFFRDYVYLPLVWNRGGVKAASVFMMVTMLLCGLWHGASWTFVVWGGYHGLLLVMYLNLSHLWDRLPTAGRRTGMFLLATMGWVLFRSETAAMAGTLFEKLFVPTAGTGAPSALMLLGLLLPAGMWAVVGPNAFDIDKRLKGDWPAWGDYAAAVALGAAVAVILGGGGSPFLYFQF